MSFLKGFWGKPKQRIRIMLVFGTLAVFLIISAYYGTKTLSGVRAYIAAEGIWSKSQKEATQQILEFSLFEDETYFQEFQKTLQLQYSFSQSRETMMSENPNYKTAKKGFQISELHTDDIELMVWLGSNFSDMPYLREAFSIWKQGDEQIARLDSLASELHQIIVTKQLTIGERDRFVNEIREIDHRLTQLENSFSATLTEGAHWVRDLIFWITLGSGILLIGLGYIITSSYFRKIHDLNSELRHLSWVAEKTTDLVIITDAQERITWVNKTFEQVTGYSLNKIKGEIPGDFLQGPDTDREAVKKFAKAVSEKDSARQRILNYTKEGEKIWLDITIDPIFNNEGTCTHFIAIERDITDQVKQEKEARESLERYNIVARATSDTIWDFDLEKNVLRYNDVIREMFGYKETKIEDVQDWWRDKIHPDDHEKVFGKLDEVLESEIDRFQFEYRFKCVDGSYKHILDRAFVVTDDDGNSVRMIGAMQDITERKRTKDALQNSQQRMETLFSNLPGMAYRCKNEKQWPMVFLSEGCRDVTGYKADTFIGGKKESKISYGDIIHEDDQEYVWNSVQKAIENKKQYEITYRIYHKDGQVRWVWERGIAVQYESGNGLYLEGFISDITARKQAEEKLKATERKMREIIEHSTNMFYRHTTDHVLTYVSPQVQDFLGCDPKEAMTRWTEFATDKPVNKKGFNRTARAIKTGKPQPAFELELEKKTGETIWVEVNEAPVVENGKTTAIVGSLTDITERKKAEQEIAEALKEKETLLAEVHHRVKNNMAVVSGIMQLQAFQEDNDQLKEKLYDNVARIGTMASIHENLYQSKTFATLKFSDNLENIIKKLIRTMQSETKITVETDFEPIQLNLNQAIPCSLIVSEVITNAIKHAFKDREQGKLAVSLKEESNQVILKIKDNGVGLPEEINHSGPDQSLGLHLIQRLSQQLDADYDYESKDKGTLFRLTFERSGI